MQPHSLSEHTGDQCDQWWGDGDGADNMISAFLEYTVMGLPSNPPPVQCSVDFGSDMAIQTNVSLETHGLVALGAPIPGEVQLASFGDEVCDGCDGIACQTNTTLANMIALDLGSVVGSVSGELETQVVATCEDSAASLVLHDMPRQVSDIRWPEPIDDTNHTGTKRESNPSSVQNLDRNDGKSDTGLLEEVEAADRFDTPEEEDYDDDDATSVAPSLSMHTDVCAAAPRRLTASWWEESDDGAENKLQEKVEMLSSLSSSSPSPSPLPSTKKQKKKSKTGELPRPPEQVDLLENEEVSSSLYRGDMALLVACAQCLDRPPDTRWQRFRKPASQQTTQMAEAQLKVGIPVPELQALCNMLASELVFYMQKTYDNDPCEGMTTVQQMLLDLGCRMIGHPHAGDIAFQELHGTEHNK